MAAPDAGPKGHRMFADQVAAAIEGARGHAALNELSRRIWTAWGEGLVTEDDAGRFAELIHERKAALGEAMTGNSPSSRRPSIFPPRKPQRAPVRAAAIERRRTLAASGPLPPALASRFTTAELAVLRIVADEHLVKGSCDRTVAEIAARAGTSRSVVKRTLRLAAELRLVTVTERPVNGAKNLPNLVRVVDATWLAWLKRGGRIGVQNRPPTDSIGFRKGASGTRNAKTIPGRTKAERWPRPVRYSGA